VVEKSSMELTEKTLALLVIEGEKALIEEKDLAEHASEGVRRREANQYYQERIFHTPTGGADADGAEVMTRRWIHSHCRFTRSESCGIPN
jgi:hypothetical protein